MDLKQLDGKIVNIEHVKARNNVWVYLFFRDGVKRYYSVFRGGFKPYFYVPEQEEIPEHIKPVVLSVGHGHKSLFGSPLKKLTFNSIHERTFLKARDAFSKTYEDDVIFNQRFLIDKNLNFSTKQRVHYIDIETDFSLDIRGASKPITTMVLYDSFLKEYHAWVWRKDLTPKTRRAEYKGDPVKIYYFSSEVDMFNHYLNFYENNWPDIVTAWNMIRFDAPYLINRIKRLGLNHKRLSQLQKVFVKIPEEGSTDSPFVKVWGHEYIDLKEWTMDLIKGEFPKPPGGSLGVIAEWMFGEEKISIEETPDILWRKHLEDLILYNIKDVYLLKKIDETRGVINFRIALQQVAPMKLFYTSHDSKIVDVYTLREYHGEYCFPSKRKREREKLKGGYVYGPFKGFYKNCVIMDFSSMYPNIYITFNISPETATEAENAGIKITGYENDEIDLRNYEHLRFNSDVQGIIPKMLGKLLLVRGRYKKLRDEAKAKGDKETEKKYNQMQIATKTVLNSFYGVMGYPKFRLFNIDIANAITYIGRTLMKHSIAEMDKLGHRVIYGDTDSIFVIFDENLTPEETIKEAEKALKVVNKKIVEKCKEFYPEMEKCTMKLNMEKVFRTYVMGDSKKRYAGIVHWKDGYIVDEIYARGFEVIRKDTPKPCQKILKKGFREVLEGVSYSEVINNSKDRMFEAIKVNTLFDLGYSKTINKDLDKYKANAQHVRAAKYSNANLNTNFTRMKTPRVLYVKRTPQGMPPTDVVAIEDTLTREKLLKMGFEFDWNKYFEKYIFNHLNKILEVIYGKKKYVHIDQRGLGDYFGTK